VELKSVPGLAAVIREAQMVQLPRENDEISFLAFHWNKARLEQSIAGRWP